MKNLIYLLLPLVMILSSCEEDINLEIPAGEEALVVEGFIEQEAPPVVMLTRTRPLFSGGSLSDFESLYVHGATIEVVSEGQRYALTETSAATMPPELANVVSEQFGLPLQVLQPGSALPFYVYTNNALKGKIGKSYRLEIHYEDKHLSASTTIPQLNPLDSLWLVPHPNPQQDSLFTLYYSYTDPDTIGNSIRYFTKRNSEPFYPGTFSSVFNDELINGSAKVSLPLTRGEPKGREEYPETFGYFGRGDTITVRWSTLDIAHYRFWYTLESEQNNNGSPISSPNTTRSNIKGGIGIWGGYGVTYHSIVVK